MASERRKRVRADVPSEPKRGTHLMLSATARRTLDLVALERGVTCSRIVEDLISEAGRGLYLARRQTGSPEGEGA